MLDRIPARILDRIAFEPMSGCWLWEGPLNPKGYARVWNPVGTTRQGLRFMVELVRGEPLPPDQEPDHRCKNRCCINPDHADVVPQDENKRRANAARDYSRTVRFRWARG